MKLIAPLICLAAFVLAGCASEAPNVTATKSFVSEFGSPNKEQSPLFQRFGEGGKGYFMDRYYATAENPRAFHTYLLKENLSPSGQNLAMDVGIEVRAEGGMPIYRMVLVPRRMTQAQIDALPEYLVQHDTQVRPPFLPGYTVARLPADRTLGPDGEIVTEWTFCRRCIGFDSVDPAQGTKAVAETQQNVAYVAGIANRESKFAEPPSKPKPGDFTPFHKRMAFVDGASLDIPKLMGEPYGFGEEQARMAAREAQTILAALPEAAEQAQREREAARTAYRDFVTKAYEPRQMTTHLDEACSNPKSAWQGALRGSDYGRAQERAIAYATCIGEQASNWDLVYYVENYATFVEREEALAVPGITRTTIRTPEQQLGIPEERVKAIERDTLAMGDRLQRQARARAEEERRSAEASRQAEIDRQVKRCMLGLASTGSLTPYSQGFCRAQAERGLDGLQAAIIGSAGATSRNPAGSAGTSPVTGTTASGFGSSGFTGNLVPPLDINGMIANARAVAKGADPGLLFNRDGTVRTTIAPEALARSASSSRDSGGTGTRTASAEPSRDRAATTSRTGSNTGRTASAAASQDKPAPDRNSVVFFSPGTMDSRLYHYDIKPCGNIGLPSGAAPMCQMVNEIRLFRLGQRAKICSETENPDLKFPEAYGDVRYAGVVRVSNLTQEEAAQMLRKWNADSEISWMMASTDPASLETALEAKIVDVTNRKSRSVSGEPELFRGVPELHSFVTGKGCRGVEFINGYMGNGRTGL
ncbi:hypothetical protein [Futiania mangrovi]|uniref:Uncharacterized protein n=1 Tax=Futiania mangrovi TaxID=2959716 RepID=A0A9J6PCU0_9PROT|nr:hypothetical protein [Futiania mangrovii]MCP1335475.1 hypothetical protein [Futiania mangrovii]